MIPLRDTIPHTHFPKLVLLLIIANTLLFLFESSLEASSLQSLLYEFGMVPARLSEPAWASRAGLHPSGGYLSLVTNIFLHGGWMHLIGNMWSLWLFGDNVEDRMGSSRFLMFYLVCGFAASLTHYFTNTDSVVPAIGASGAIAGVMGAYFRMFPHSRVVTLIPIFFIFTTAQIPAVIFLGIWFLTQIMSGTASLGLPSDAGGVAFWAHVGGFVAGLLTYRLFLNKKRIEEANNLARRLRQRGITSDHWHWRNSA